mgnify:CR=1 FL=1
MTTVNDEQKPTETMKSKLLAFSAWTMVISFVVALFLQSTILMGVAGIALMVVVFTSEPETESIYLG